MSKVATAQVVTAHRSGLDVALLIQGQGTLTMPRAAAHELARALMRVVSEIDAVSPGESWPGLHTKQ